MKVTACIICKNEERNIRDCLESVKWADEIVVVDSGSTDRTVEIAKEYTPNVFFNEWRGYNAQREFAMAKATSDWVFCLDADERCTPELRDAIRASLSDGVDGFYVKRHTYYLGRWINHGGWYPDWKLRVVRRGQAKCTGIEPHDLIEVPGPTARLHADLLHYTYANFSAQLRQIDKFSDVFRDRWIQEGRKPSLLMMLLHPWWKFFEVYLFKLGLLDGRAGFVIAVATAFYTFAKHVKLWEAKTCASRS